jgi:hypothetical protein
MSFFSISAGDVEIRSCLVGVVVYISLSDWMQFGPNEGFLPQTSSSKYPDSLQSFPRAMNRERFMEKMFS